MYVRRTQLRASAQRTDGLVLAHGPRGKPVAPVAAHTRLPLPPHGRVSDGPPPPRPHGDGSEFVSLCVVESDLQERVPEISEPPVAMEGRIVGFVFRLILILDEVGVVGGNVEILAHEITSNQGAGVGFWLVAPSGGGVAWELRADPGSD
jgi:hypothetical protein